MLMASRDENDQYGLSRCHPVGFAQGSLMRAWSCQMRIPSTPARSVAIFPSLVSSINRRTPSWSIHRLSRWVKALS